MLAEPVATFGSMSRSLLTTLTSATTRVKRQSHFAAKPASGSSSQATDFMQGSTLQVHLCSKESDVLTHGRSTQLFALIVPFAECR